MNLLDAGNKKSDFSADLSLKYRFSGGFEKICTGKNRKKKNREKIADFSRKIRYFPEISPKNCFPFVPWLKKYEKIASDGWFRMHPKFLEVTPSSHQAIDYTYYI